MELKEFFENNKKPALGLSGGVDSALLLYFGKYYGADIRPYFVQSVFQPEFELQHAQRFCRELGIDLTVIELDILADKEVRSNSSSRCYFCKKAIFSALIKRAAEDGCDCVIDGTNASDESSDRPGMRALTELSVLSPLRECGISKAGVRMLAESVGLFLWDKPAYACLATRIQSGEEISESILKSIESAENILFKMGFSDFRVRVSAGVATIQVVNQQRKMAEEHFSEISERFQPFFSCTVLDAHDRKASL